MAIYRKIEIPTTTRKGKRHLSTTRYPSIPISDNDIQILTDKGDRLDNLAFRFYGDTSFWIWLVLANPNKTRRDSYYVDAGVQLRVPTNINGVTLNFKNINK
mgnify:CR=1 FL=1|jgi:hypothetical protein